MRKELSALRRNRPGAYASGSVGVGDVIQMPAARVRGLSWWFLGLGLGCFFSAFGEVECECCSEYY